MMIQILRAVVGGGSRRRLAGSGEVWAAAPAERRSEEASEWASGACERSVAAAAAAACQLCLRATPFSVPAGELVDSR